MNIRTESFGPKRGRCTVLVEEEEEEEGVGVGMRKRSIDTKTLDCNTSFVQQTKLYLPLCQRATSD